MDWWKFVMDKFKGLMTGDETWYDKQLHKLGFRNKVAADCMVL